MRSLGLALAEATEGAACAYLRVRAVPTRPCSPRRSHALVHALPRRARLPLTVPSAAPLAQVIDQRAIDRAGDGGGGRGRGARISTGERRPNAPMLTQPLARYMWSRTPATTRRCTLLPALRERCRHRCSRRCARHVRMHDPGRMSALQRWGERPQRSGESWHNGCVFRFPFSPCMRFPRDRHSFCSAPRRDVAHAEPHGGDGVGKPGTEMR